MKKISIVFLTFLASINISNAQDSDSTHKCGTEILSTQWENEFQKLIKQFKISHQNKSLDSNYTYVIPVIFHIIHGGEAIGTFPNIDSGQIYSQIDVLNQDFNGIGENANTYPITAFTNWVANESLPAANIDSLGRVKIGCLNILFCPATKDTLGNILTEPGINRVDYNALGIANPNSFTTTTTLKPYLDDLLKPKTIWNATKYFNVWTTDKNVAVMFTGVSSTPPLTGLAGLGPGSSDSTDGIWLYAKVTGSPIIYPVGVYGNPNVRGRTATHEVGHWLGLRHIWGDAACATDYCNDTPPAASDNTGIPTYPHNVGTCTSNSPEGEMFMNFMDYTLDPYKYMFTTDQVIRMQTALLNSPNRNLLGSHNLCSSITTSVNELSNISIPFIYPNPTNGMFTIENTNPIENVKIYNLTGQVVYENKINSNKMNIDLSNQPNGIYFVHLQVEGGQHLAYKLVKN